MGVEGRNSEADVANLWIFDLQKGRASVLAEAGQWYPATHWPVLLTRDKHIYILGGECDTTARSLSFDALADLISYGAIRSAFRSHMKIPLWLSMDLGGGILGYLPPSCL